MSSLFDVKRKSLIMASSNKIAECRQPYSTLTPVYGMAMLYYKCTRSHLKTDEEKMGTNLGISPRTRRICDNDKQAGGNKVRLFDFVIKRNLLGGGICHAENLGNLAILKKAEFRMKRICKSR